MKLNFDKKIGLYEIKSVSRFRTNLKEEMELNTIVIYKCENEQNNCKAIAYWKLGLKSYELKFIDNLILEIDNNIELLTTIKEAQLTLDEFCKINKVYKKEEKLSGVFY